MAERRDSSWLTLAAEIAAWSMAIAIFLWIYTHTYAAPQQAILPHVRVVVATWSLAAFCRMVVWRSGNHPVQRWLATLLIVFPFSVLITSYAAMMTGLSSWGRIPTLSLIRVYFQQIGALLEVLQITPLQAALALTIPFSLLAVATYRLFTPHDWSRKFSKKSPSVIPAVSIVAAALASALELLQFRAAPPTKAFEPFAIALFPEQAGKLLQNQRRSTSPLLDANEVKARSVLENSISQRPVTNVFLIVGDALRFDHMGVYGYSRDTTPLLNLRLRTTPFTRTKTMRSICAESSCGLMALAASRSIDTLPNNPVTLHQVMKHHGYRVSLLLSGDHTNFYGLKDAYGPVDEYFDGSMQSVRYVNDDRLLLDRLRKLSAYDGKQPAFIQFHLMSTHALGARSNVNQTFLPQENYYRWPTSGDFLLNEEQVDRARNYYDNGVLGFDRITDGIIETLRSKGYLQNAIVIITGDHGEMLGEHGQLAHAKDLFEEVLRIPLIALYFGPANRLEINRSLLTQLDLAPSLVKALGISEPSTWQGRPMEIDQEPPFVAIRQGNLQGLYDLHSDGSAFKYWRSNDGKVERAFNLSQDPEESQNMVRHINSNQLQAWRLQILKNGMDHSRID